MDTKTQFSNDRNVAYYDQNTDSFIERTIKVDMQLLYTPFLKYVREAGRILDAGCGSGRDTKAFLDLGYTVTAFDASKTMAESASRHTGQVIEVGRFQDMQYEQVFDGLWCCASLLHVSIAEFDDVLGRCIRALRPTGVGFMCFKEGAGEVMRGDRRFTDFTEESLGSLLAERVGMDILRIWRTDPLHGNPEPWINALWRPAG
ncbi:MAG: class I SAM-dependent methyltransferase [Pseudomonadales bacterium]